MNSLVKNEITNYSESMFETILFLGFPVSDSYERILRQLPEVERDLFIGSSDSSYLQKVENEGVQYLGKYLGPIIEMGALEMSSSHIYSLLKKWVPHFSYDCQSLVLLAVPV